MQNDFTLARLAEAVGILPSYVDQTGTETRVTSDRTRVAILGAMGIDASTPDRAREAMEALEASESSRLLAPVRVVRAGDPDASRVVVRGPQGDGAVEWTLELVPESGDATRRTGSTPLERDGSFVLSLPRTPAEGYHTVRVTLRAEDEERSGEQSLIVVPDACPSVRDLTGTDRVFGVIANLYSVRSGGNWGIGDLSDLARLLEWTGEVGGAFVGVNPLHALRNQGTDISPYSPVSRVFRNAIYLDVAAVPELEDSDEARRLVESSELRRERDALNAGDRVEYERVMTLKTHVLRALHDTFSALHLDAGAERGRAYRQFVEAQGEPLTRFATFEALTDHLGGGNWREWPEHLRDSRSPEVAEFRARHPREVDFHRWLQFELDRQLGEAAARGRAAGLGIGLYQDLAIGTSPSSADVWGNPHLFLDGVGIGAPPDEYARSGQNWGLAPLDPRALREDGYRYWIRLVRASMRHAGALRIDHVLGLFRQFWIPEGMQGKDGAYVRFPAAELLGVVALEARRHGALVVGEDLGTVPEDVPPTLHARGVLSSRVFYFEREDDSFRAAAEYEPMALATANTHDMPTLAGFWCGRDIEVGREVGLVESDAEAEEQRQARVKERRAVLERLAADGVLHDAREPATGAALRGAVHAFLCRTPAALVGLSLDDLLGEVEPVNVPGVPPDRFSAWTRKLSKPLEALHDDADVRVALPQGRDVPGP